MSIVSVLVGTTALLSDFFTRGVFYGGRRGGSRSRGRSSGSLGIWLFLIGVVLLILSPIIAQLIKLAIGRNREYLADATAALLTRYPKGLADALKKLAMDKEFLEVANGATAHLYIVSPLMAQGRKSLLGTMFSTHPPIDERIKRLESM